jgi:molecular chaperone DnaK (HSP70)
MSASYVVGIDLGTTNSVVAYTKVDTPDIQPFAVPQLVGPNEVDQSLNQVPSMIYLPANEEFGAGATRLPWGEDASAFVGAFAAQHGAKVPGRLVHSAKSWLSYAGVDREAAILPWGGAADVAKMSPVEASAQILSHIRAAWDAAHPDSPLGEQEVILTVPASFDEVAREFTVRAAQRAGLKTLRLIEEPQAAFYNVIRNHPESLNTLLQDMAIILVVDVGGGTTDLTLVQVEESPSGVPTFERLAVGEHLMLGGDNMDVTLARNVEQALTGSIGSLDAAQWGALVQSCRLAKEKLFVENAPDQYGVSLVSRGSKLIGGAKTHTLTPEAVSDLLVDGFFPKSAATEGPHKKARTALQEFALPYASDPGICRHIAGFLQHHADALPERRTPDGLLRIDGILLNGGVFKSARLKERLAATFQAWYGKAIPFLPHQSLDEAVALGAAYYGLVRRGLGLRIGGGSARAYFVGVEGEDGAQKALCVAPRGMLEGATHEVEQVFTLRLGQPVSFPLFTSTKHVQTGAGDLVGPDQNLNPLPPLQTVLKESPEVPVRLKAHLTEVGTLEISLQMIPEALRQWAVAFSTRDEGGIGPQGQGSTSSGEAVHQRIDEAKDKVADFFGNKSKDVDAKGVKQLQRALEKILGARETWSLAVGRELAGALLAGAKRRRRSPDHERLFLQLTGFCCRPGFGAAYDDFRVKEIFKVFQGGVHNVKEKPVWAAWWIMLRRIAGGLSAEEQRTVYDLMAPHLPHNKVEGKKIEGTKPHGIDEMVRLMGALERLPFEIKIEFGDWALKKVGTDARLYGWALGRAGARQPLRGSAHDVVPANVAERWLKTLFNYNWRDDEGAAFAAAQIARRTGDRQRDIDEEVRRRVIERLERAKMPEAWTDMVKEVVELSAKDEARLLGDSLPVGLKLH